MFRQPLVLASPPPAGTLPLSPHPRLLQPRRPLCEVGRKHTAKAQWPVNAKNIFWGESKEFGRSGVASPLVIPSRCDLEASRQMQMLSQERDDNGGAANRLSFPIHFMA